MGHNLTIEGFGNDDILDSENGKTIGDMRFKNIEILTVVNRQTEYIHQAVLLDQDGNLLEKPKANSRNGYNVKMFIYFFKIYIYLNNLYLFIFFIFIYNYLNIFIFMYFNLEINSLIHIKFHIIDSYNL